MLPRVSRVVRNTTVKRPSLLNGRLFSLSCSLSFSQSFSQSFSLPFSLLVWLPFVSGCFDATVPKTVVVSCRDGGDCPTGSFCLAGDPPRCVGADAPCVEFSGREAAAVPDGTGCGEGLICVAAACVSSRCGDGIVTSAETCDGDVVDCRADCTRCGDGVLDSGESCDNGAQNSDVQPGACRTTCALASCGDGVRDPGEGCDDGVGNSDVLADACRTSCVRAACSDGVVDQAEVCDDGNTDSSDGCRGDCGKVERCGDGVVDGGEVCDDGNDNPRDGCAACREQGWRTDLVVAGSTESRVATESSVGRVSDVAVDVLGRVFVVDPFNNRIRRVDVDGTMSTIAGTGAFGFSGDGAPATSTSLGVPNGVAVDPAGRVFLADTYNQRIRRIDADGRVVTIAGTGTEGFSGDGGPATRATLRRPEGVAVDAAGRVFIADTENHRIRRIDVDGTIRTIAGTGTAGWSGDGSQAITAALNGPLGIALDAAGRVFIADTRNHRVRRVDVDGTISTIAGTGIGGFSGDGGPATNAALQQPNDVAVDRAGRVFVTDHLNNVVRRIDLDGTIGSIAGRAVFGFGGDGGPATSAMLAFPRGIAVDTMGRLFVADVYNQRVRRIDIDGTIGTIAGTGLAGFSGAGGPASSAVLFAPKGVAVDDVGRVVISDTVNSLIRRIEADDTIATIAGTGVDGATGDGGPASAASVSFPADVATDAFGRIFVVDYFNHRIRRIDADGTISTVAGTGSNGFFGDGGPAVSAALSFAEGVAVDGDGVVFIADTNNHRVRRVDADGTITTIAGTGASGFSGDRGPATRAALSSPKGVAIDTAGRVIIADTFNHRVRRVEVDGTITTIAGTGIAGFFGDGGLATRAGLSSPGGLAVDPSGRIFIADTDHQRIRRIDTDGTMITIAGSGVRGFAGDAGPATSAALNLPRDIAIDAVGRVLIADTDNARVRCVDVDGAISTVAGSAHPGGPGPRTRARLYSSASLVPLGVATLVSVGDFGRALRVDTDAVDIVVGYDQASPDAFARARFAPLLQDARGVVFDPVAQTLVITEHATGDLRIIDLDPDGDGVIDDPAAWTNASVATDLRGPAGIVYDDASDMFVVVDEADHCVRRVDRDGVVQAAPVFGRCGRPGLFPGFLSDPTHVVVSPVTGAVYVADTGNHRVLRVLDGAASLVVGDGSVSSAGEGSPARLFPVNAPRQLALDDFGNLYVASTTTVRLVENVDGDDDADGDDRVATIFGGGARDTFPESDTFCLHTVAVDDMGDVYAADACQGYMVKLSSVVD
jgi:cysteine-rich repeat protein